MGEACEVGRSSWYGGGATGVCVRASERACACSASGSVQRVVPPRWDGGLAVRRRVWWWRWYQVVVVAVPRVVAEGGAEVVGSGWTATRDRQVLQ